jgi:hypothetical protein
MSHTQNWTNCTQLLLRGFLYKENSTILLAVGCCYPLRKPQAAWCLRIPTLWENFSLPYIQSVPRGKVNILGGHSMCHSKQKLYMYMCPILNGFRYRASSLYSSKIVDKKKRYYVLFVIPVFIVQVTTLVQCNYYNTFSKIAPSTSVHFASHVRTWLVARLYSEIALSQKPFMIGHTYIYTFILLRITNTMTSQSIDLSSWDTGIIQFSIIICKLTI